MSIIVEDGTGLANANSYVSVADADAYHAARGNATWTEASTSPDQGKTAALARATAAIDAIYGMRFPGTKINGRDQALQWPREDAFDINGLEIDADAVPTEIKQATFEAALRELVTTGSMMPDLERGGAVKRLKAGSVEVEYGGSATPGTVFSLIDGILAVLIGPSGGAGYTAKAARG